MGGSSGQSGGGGGGSGTVDYPDYMKDFHENLLGTGNVGSDITTVMNTALGNSPWALQTSYDPDADIATYIASIADFATLLNGVDYTVDWSTFYNQGVATINAAVDNYINDDVDAFADQLDDEVTTKILPRFQAGMRDINAVVSSAFPIGQAVIEGFRNRDVSKHASTMRVNVGNTFSQQYLEASNQMLNLMINRLNFEDSYAKLNVEAMRIKIIAKKEQNEAEVTYDENDALWDLEVFQYGANLLAAIGGGTSTPHTKANQPSRAQSVIGGALSGAAAGAMVGNAVPGIGTAVGAVVGGVLGAAAGLL